MDQYRASPAVWICGPPGSGKTTLVSGYIAARKIPCLWYRVDRWDADPAGFFHHLGLAARRAAPRSRKPFPALTPDLRPGLDAFAGAFFQRLFDVLPSGCAVVFDNCNEVPHDTPFPGILHEALSRLPSKCRMIMMGRESPPSALARLDMERSVRILGWNDLRMTLEETRVFCEHGKPAPRSEAEIRRLWKRSDGWILGLSLLAREIRREGAEPGRLDAKVPEALFDYFGSEAFEKLDVEIRDFLLRIAVLPSVTAEGAEALTGSAGSASILDFLRQGNLFLERYDLAKPAYLFHPLFREFLLARGRQTFPPTELSALKKRAAEILERHGRQEEAAALFRELGDFPELARVALSFAPALVNQGRHSLLEEWLASLPESTFGEDPWISYWLGVCRLPVDPPRSRRHFEEAFRRFHGREGIPGRFLAWEGYANAASLSFGFPFDLAAWLSTLEELLTEAGGFPSPEIETRVLCTVATCIGMRCIPPDMEETWVKRAREATGGIANPLLRAWLQSSVALNLILVGEVAEAEVLLKGLRGLRRNPDVPPLIRVSIYWAEAIHAILSARYAETQSAVSVGLDVARDTGFHFNDTMLRGFGALAALLGHDPGTAARHLREMESSLPSAFPINAAFYHQLSAWVALQAGDTTLARAHFEQSVAPPDFPRNKAVIFLTTLQHAFLLLDTGQRGRADEVLGEAIRFAEERRKPGLLFEARLAQAYFLLDKGEDVAARPALEEGMRIGRELGVFGIFFHRPGFLERLASRALESGIEPDYVRELIRRNDLMPDRNMSDLERWPWPVRLYTLGRFQVVLGDGPVVFPRKAQQKPIALLKALIALGGKDVGEERLSDHLWPDAEGDLAHTSFDTTVSRLRNILKNEKAVVVRGARVSLNDRICWVDAWAFERLLADAQAAVTTRPRVRNARLEEAAAKALSLYKGAFLPGEKGLPGVESVRERLRSRFLRGSGNLGRYWLDAGVPEASIDCFRRGLEVDDLAEELYRGLIACYRRMGRDAEAMMTWEKCSQRLREAFGVRPSAETEAALRSPRESRSPVGTES